MLRKLLRRLRRGLLPPALALAVAVMAFLLTQPALAPTVDDGFYDRYARGAVSIAVENDGELVLGGSGFLMAVPGKGLLVVTARHVVENVAPSGKSCIFRDALHWAKPTGAGGCVPVLAADVSDEADVGLLIPDDQLLFQALMGAYHLEPYALSDIPPIPGDGVVVVGSSWNSAGYLNWGWAVVHGGVILEGTAMQEAETPWADSVKVGIPYWKSMQFYTAPAISGYSGAALLNERGEVIGIHVGRIAGQSLAVRWADLASFLMPVSGEVPRPYERRNVAQSVSRANLCAHTSVAVSDCP